MHRIADLDRVREIGRRKWDIVSALSTSAPPQPVIDHYLLGALERISRGWDDGAVADYIIDAAIECLGVDTGSGIRERALSLVTALRDELPPLERTESSSAVAHPRGGIVPGPLRPGQL